MALPSTGIITAAMVNTELNRASDAPINLNDPAVRALAQKPSGEISFADLRGKSAEVVLYAPLGNGEAYCSNIFNNHQAGLWTSNQKKKLIVNGDRNSLRINSQFGGEFTLEIVPGGYLSGGTWVEGLAIDTAVTRAPTVINNGVIRGKGGNGGQGGTGGRGGGGYWDNGYWVWDPGNASWLYDANNANKYYWQTYSSDTRNILYWGNVSLFDQTNGNTGEIAPGDGWVYEKGPIAEDGGLFGRKYQIRRRRWQVDRIWTEGGWGGAGGAGGNGIGYGIARTDGAWGAGGTAGGTNAGAGGSGGRGGTGGDWGQTGATGAVGNTGAPGNAAGGTAGTGGSGGATSWCIWGRNRINYSGSGQLIGPTANN